MDGLLIEDLADAPPAYWASIIERTALVDRYIAAARPKWRLEEELTAQLGIVRRTFLRLVAHRRSRLKGAEARWRQTGRTTRTLDAHERIIGDAIDVVGPGARRTEVRDLVHRMCGDHAIAVPSIDVVYARCAERRGDAAAALRIRLGIEEGIVVDACPLLVSMQEEDRPAVPAWLVMTIDCATGRILAHDICARDRIGEHLPATPPSGAGVGGDRGIGDVVLTSAFDRRAGATDPEQKEHSSTRARLCDADDLKAGEALRIVLGARIGRMPLRSPERREVGGDVVDVHALRSVIRHLVDVRNAELDG